MTLVGDLLRYVAAAALGVYAGAMLTEGFVLVPFWRALPPAEFLRWYAANDRRLVGFFGPVTSAAGVTALAAAGVSLWEGHPGRWPAVVAAVLMLVSVAAYFVYFERVNARFAAAAIPVDDVGAELARWNAWHTMRTVLSGVALAAALAALQRAS